jgi:crotonobetainyl-CoA:carnitine CoA-transferase CaiB-like acyl-CoA transferase
MLPLDGIRVLDLASMIAGPFGATMLGDMGADVIKIEPPAGDEARQMGPRVGDDSGLYVGVNRNKRGVVLDLGQAEGRDVFFKLVATADIVIDNLRPQAKRKLGLSYEEIARHNPRIIGISVSTFGQDGPYAGRPGIDPLAQALSGFMSITGEGNGRPLKAGPAIADITCAHLVAYAAMLGLWAREQHGVGQAIDISLLDGLINAQCAQLGQYFFTGYTPPRLGNGSPFYGPYGTFQCRDGRDIFVASYNDKFFHNLCRAIDRPDLIGDSRFLTPEDRVAQRDALESEIRLAFLQWTCDEMMARLVAEDVIAAPVNDYEHAFADPQVAHNAMVVKVEHARAGAIKVGGVPVKLRKTPGAVRRAPPTRGQHSTEILRDLGFTEGEIDRLRRLGAAR